MRASTFGYSMGTAMFRDSQITISDGGVALAFAFLAVLMGKAIAAAWKNAKSNLPLKT
jgi:hypothetical protein